jgi:outer membrane lipoprotein-sorting protein
MNSFEIRPTFGLRFVAATAIVASLALSDAFAAPSASPDPWATLRAVRESLAAQGPLEADFSQTFLPQGFTTGETERGVLAIALPDCLRWDYQEPYSKSFLICGGTAWAWNAEDRSGRRFSLDRKSEPGLDLLLLATGDLEKRYKASARSLDDGGIEVTLTPLGSAAKGSPVKEAKLVTDRAGKRLIQVSYRDGDGNQTRFDLSSYRDLPRRGRFSAPEGIAWEDER